MNYTARFIQVAEVYLFGVPQYALGKIADALNDAGKPLRGSRVLLLGVAYKVDTGDLRESPALDILHLLRGKGADLAYHDPYVPQVRLDDFILDSATLDRQILHWADCVVITTAHSSYDWSWVAQHSRLLVDTRNVIRPTDTQAKVVKL
jgi:UDP-N-acetyl-D-glucosamine dehydrogenase